MKLNLNYNTWRWDLLAVGVGALIILALGTQPSGYFLHFDSANQNFMALAWLNDCWEFDTEKFFPVIVLMLTFKLFGVNPFWETLWLLVIGAATLGLVYELTRLMTDSKRAGVLASLFLLALPAFQYYSRIYIGFALFLLLMAWWAIYYRYWWLVGISFSLASLSHFSALFITGLSCLALFVFYAPFRTWRVWLKVGLGLLAPILFVELLYFLFMGVPFQWTQATLGTTFKHSGAGVVGTSSFTSNWFWAWDNIFNYNGLWLSLFFILAGLVFTIYKFQPFGFALGLSFASMLFVYIVLAGLGRSFTPPRLLALGYPFWVIGIGLIWKSLQRKLPLLVGHVAYGMGLLILSGLVWQSTISIRVFAQTVYPSMAQWFQRAATENRPVRFSGNPTIGEFYGQLYGVRTLINDSTWIDQSSPNQAVLIFERGASPKLSKENYVIEHYRIPETLPASLALMLTESELRREAEAWFPTQPSGEVNLPPDVGHPTFFYPGSGCFTQPYYANGTLHFYELAWQKLITYLGRAK